MKKFMFAAVAALFVVSAHAGEAAKTAPAAPTTEKDCVAAKGMWDKATSMCKMEAAPAAPAKK